MAFNIFKILGNYQDPPTTKTAPLELKAMFVYLYVIYTVIKDNKNKFLTVTL